MIRSMHAMELGYIHDFVSIVNNAIVSCAERIQILLAIIFQEKWSNICSDFERSNQRISVQFKRTYYHQNTRTFT